jgi:hypothetical protein
LLPLTVLRQQDKLPADFPGGVAEWPNAPVLKTVPHVTQPTDNPTTYEAPQKSLSHSLPSPLTELIQRWNDLPEPLRQAIIAIMRSAKQ